LILLCGIKLHQRPISSVKQKLIEDEIIWDNGVIKPADPNIDFEIVYILKLPSDGDSNGMSVFYLRSNFFVQTHATDTKTDFETMNNINIFMRIANVFLPNLPITSAGGEYKNDSYTSTLTYNDYIEVVDTTLCLIDLL
jgi:hypothetical protein